MHLDTSFLLGVREVQRRVLSYHDIDFVDREYVCAELALYLVSLEFEGWRAIGAQPSPDSIADSAQAD